MGRGESSEGQIRYGVVNNINRVVVGLGKQMLVTGLFMSAAPFLVMGFGFCGPACAVLWGSYAFTSRIMSILLPDVQLDDDDKLDIEFEDSILLSSQDQKADDRNVAANSTAAAKEQPHPIAPGVDKDAQETKQDDDHDSTKQADTSSTATAEKKPASDEDEDYKRSETDQTTPNQQASQSPKNDTAQSSDKAFKTWEQIRAVRAIVGFTATPKSTCVEEVKALYLFTGVEPPPASNIQESDKLHFLMSIIGVK